MSGAEKKSNAETELKMILNDIREKTGTNVLLTPCDGTRFVIDYCGKSVEAWLEETGEDAERTAKLIGYLIGSVDLKQLLPDKNEYLKNILLGEGSGWYVYRFLTKYNVPDAPCYAVDLHVDRRPSESLSQIESCLSDGEGLAVCMDEGRIAVVKFEDGAQTPVEFGSFLSQSLYEELGVRAGMGIGCEVKSFTEIARSYNQAATAVRMSALLHSKGNVHTYREYLLIKMLEDVPEGRLKEYMEQFRVSGAKEIFSDEEIIGTAEEFLENSLNISETSRNLFMHRNTLMYRLDKIERLTGLNIRKFSDAVTFRIVTILYKLLQ